MEEGKFPTGVVIMQVNEYSEIVSRLATAEAHLENERLDKWRTQDRAKRLEEENMNLKAQISLLAGRDCDDGK